jgi:hypothetical protein
MASSPTGGSRSNSLASEVDRPTAVDEDTAHRPSALPSAYLANYGIQMSPASEAPALDVPAGYLSHYGISAPTKDSGSIHDAASRGTSGAGGPLPHLEPIQKSFGHHDVSGIAAHTDASAKEGSRAMGAEAFAVGQHVAFAGAPSLHTAAHEAAHVVQQRGGVHLKDGVGQAGDPYERHADAVADAVVSGRSAAGLLDQVAQGASASSRAVQRVETPDLPDMDKLGKDVDQKKVYRNYLWTLKWELMSSKVDDEDKKKELLKLADKFLDTEGVELGALADVVRQIQPLVKNIKTNKSVTSKEVKFEGMSKAEEAKFNQIITSAQSMIETTMANKNVLKETFGEKNDGDAKRSFKTIIDHLEKWKKDTTKVRVERGECGFSAANRGHGKDSKLDLGPDFFTRTDGEVEATLAHEASHGGVETADLCYIGAPFFFEMKDLGLNNADHFGYAVKRANGKLDAPQKSKDDGAKVQGGSQSLRGGFDLCFFKLQQLWTRLMWIEGFYKNDQQIKLPISTRPVHEDLMDPGGPSLVRPGQGKKNKSKVETAPKNGEGDWTDLLPIIRERTSMLIEIIDTAKDNIEDAIPAEETDRGTIKTRKRQTNKEWIEFDLKGATTPEACSDIIFVAILVRWQFTEKQAHELLEWVEGLWKEIAEDHKDDYFAKKDPAMRLYKLLKKG